MKVSGRAVPCGFFVGAGFLLEEMDMAYRYSNTDKWADAWFSELKPLEKLLFCYLYDNCDIAGFIELNTKRWANDIGTDKGTTERALKGLQRGLINAETNDCIYVRTFLKHQKNLPLSPDKNPAHRGIYKRFEMYAYKFNIQDVNEFIEGALKPLDRGIGNGNGKEFKEVVSNIKERELEFKKEVETFSTKYNMQMLTAFFAYWSEPNNNKTKMKKEMQATWDTSRRLLTWFNRSKK